jgi:chromosome partitioning protein
MKNKIVLFANQKGGVGKSTLCTFLAHDMASKGMAVIVADADLQQSLFELRDQEVKSTGISQDDLPWDMMWIDCRNVRSVKTAMQQLKQLPATILIDVPGNLSDDNLAPLYMAADVIICPMSYQVFSINSTKRFAETVRKFNSTARLIFVPNAIAARKSADDARKERSYGYELQHNFKGSWLTREVPRLKCFERISTIEFTSEQATKLQPSFEGIYKWIK